MSHAPAPLLEARAYLLARTGLPATAVGIVGDPEHGGEGYHVGWDRLAGAYGWSDYSARHARDRAGMTNAASALDIGDHPRMRELFRWLVAEARGGRLPDVREIIGTYDGKTVTRVSAEGGWRDEPGGGDDSHLTHIHISYYRDSEGRDKVSVFRRFYEQGDDMSQQASEVIEAWSTGRTKTASGWMVAPTMWQLAAEKHQAAVTAQLAAILKALGAQQADIDELQARPATVTLDAAAVSQLATQLAGPLAERLAAERDPEQIRALLAETLSRVGLVLREV